MRKKFNDNQLSSMTFNNPYYIYMSDLSLRRKIIHLLEREKDGRSNMQFSYLIGLSFKFSQQQFNCKLLHWENIFKLKKFISYHRYSFSQKRINNDFLAFLFDRIFFQPNLYLFKFFFNSNSEESQFYKKNFEFLKIIIIIIVF